MRLIIFSLILATLFLFTSCKTAKENNHSNSANDRAMYILDQTVKAHGGDLYEKANYQFVFRDNVYTFKNNGKQYNYTALKKKDGNTTYDILNNDGLIRTINDSNQNLSIADQAKYSGGINSVIYFATLPHKLQDPAVNKFYKGTTTIKGKTYEVLEVTFNQEGGGKDHDDTFHYWLNKETHLIDYLAYNYAVGKGGVRFRSAYNTRNVDGVVFQDYINYKAEVGTPLIDLPKLYEAEQLKKLSVIATEDIVNLSK